MKKTWLFISLLSLTTLYAVVADEAIDAAFTTPITLVTDEEITSILGGLQLADNPVNRITFKIYENLKRIYPNNFVSPQAPQSPYQDSYQVRLRKRYELADDIKSTIDQIPNLTDLALIHNYSKLYYFLWHDTGSEFPNVTKLYPTYRADLKELLDAITALSPEEEINAFYSKHQEWQYNPFYRKEVDKF